MNVIAQGTTPYLQIAVADDLSDASVIYITIRQGKTGIINLTGERVAVEVENGVSALTVHLTQEETLKLTEDTVSIQVRWKNTDLEAYETEIIRVRISEALYKGVI